jgi:hypothetical protein
MVPFVLPWDDADPAPTDLSQLNHFPAGRFGPVRAGADGHLYAGDDRIRFFGTNAAAGMFCPPKDAAAAYAGRMAKFGFNLVRFHHLTLRRFPNGLVRADAEKSDDFDPEALDRMDWFVHQLKRRGIYVNVNLLTGRHFSAADGLPPEIETLDWKDRHAAAFFFPRMIELQKAYARKLLTRRNPYTGLTFAEDPCVAFVEIINEHGLLNSYFDGKLDRLPGAYREELARQWNAWLAGRYAGAGSLADAWPGDSGAVLGRIPPVAKADAPPRDSPRLLDWIRFLHETERGYYAAMERFLKEDLGVQALVVGTIAQNSTPNIMAMLDAVDAHEYWNHPIKRGDWRHWYIRDGSMVGDVPRKFGFVSLFRVEGRPFTLTEFNHCPPSPYAGEGPLLLAAYASLQDWDAVYLFAYGRSREDRFRGFFGISRHPSIMANVTAAAAMFRRGDVAAARQVVLTRMRPEMEPELAARAGAAWAIAWAGQLGAQRHTAMVHRLAVRTGPQRPGQDPLPPPENVPEADRYVSDTGEVTWDGSRPDRAVVTVDSPRAKAVVGFTDGRAFDLGPVAVEPGTTRLGWCTVSLTLTEGESFDAPRRAILVLTGNTTNAGMEWKRYEDDPGPDERPHLTLDTWGDGPALIEVVPAIVRLPGPAERVRAHALDGRGRQAEPVRVYADDDGRASFAAGPPHETLWYEIVWTAPAAPADAADD